MNILILNCGSSSVKFQVAVMPGYKIIAKGGVGRIGYDDAEFTYHAGSVNQRVTAAVADHKQAIALMLETLFGADSNTGITAGDIDAVGHRVVQGGSLRSDSVIIDSSVISDIESIKELAPLHNPNHLAGIYACAQLLPDVVQVAVFDNGFHSTLPEQAYLYGLPHEYHSKHAIRKYGFHGIAFRSMAEGVKRLTGRGADQYKIVNMMLGSGTTANASLYGKSVEVSTGFTPLEGLIQSTRTGDLDPAALLYIMNKENLSPQEADELVNKRSGWSGLSGISNDMREIYDAAQNGNARAEAAIAAACHRFKKYIGAYSAVMGGVDMLVFSGGVGENAWYIRNRVTEGLGFLGLELDEDKNSSLSGEGIISSDGSKAKILVVSANEEKIIAQDTYALVNKK
ncbi:MAG: acetate/propionate family kinase [Christensenellales bacterium]|jgi:acetate kinase